MLLNVGGIEMIQVNQVHQTPVSLLGEGPHYEANFNRLIWVDIEGCKIHRYHCESGKMESISSPQKPGVIIPRDDGKYICGMQDGIYIVDFEKAEFKLLTYLEQDIELHRCNDGKCDSYGRFWVGTYPMHGGLFTGALYSLQFDTGVPQSHLQQIGCSNGIAWSADNRTMYYIDSPTKRVDAFDYQIETGAISNRRAVIEIPQGMGVPDGMTIDSDDHLWIAHWGGWCVSHWNPKTGKMLGKIELPVSQVTSVCFAGERMNKLFITSAKVGLDEKQLQQEPLAGSLFVVELERKGKENSHFVTKRS